MLSGCGNQPVKDPPQPRSFTATEVIAAEELRYVKIDPEATRDIAPRAFAPGPITNGALESRGLHLELVIKLLRAELAAVRCLCGTKPGSPEANACLAALRSIVEGAGDVIP